MHISEKYKYWLIFLINKKNNHSKDKEIKIIINK